MAAVATRGSQGSWVPPAIEVARTDTAAVPVRRPTRSGDGFGGDSLPLQRQVRTTAQELMGASFGDQGVQPRLSEAITPEAF